MWSILVENYEGTVNPSPSGSAGSSPAAPIYLSKSSYIQIKFLPFSSLKKDVHGTAILNTFNSYRFF